MRPPVAPRAALLIGLLLLALLAGACGASEAGSVASSAPASSAGGGTYPGWPIGPQAGASILPLLVNQQLAVGANRFLFTLVDARDQTTPLAAPDVTTDLAFYDLGRDPASPVASVAGVFIWAVSTPPTPRGLYHATVTFSEAGDWGVQITVTRPSQPAVTVRQQFDVLPTTTTPAIGAAAPSVATPTATTAAGIAAISTDTTPDPAFYRTSEAQALADHQPFVLVFATPQFCQSQVCGPTLDMVNSVAPPFEARVVFIHVEPYILQPATGGGLQPVLDASGNLQLVPAAVQWGLPDEPWVFVVDASGKVTAKFEGAVGADELTQAIQAVAGG
ncbi:MAG TPA: hypothetical protein VMH24_05025 [Candidatus Sulfotelmatobacter sp.]|nr:hypothetical protein [Candidatus Sulfotelmatobacter sp.]